MEKEFVSYELALRMKALGFDELCFGYYENGVFIVHYNSKQEFELLLNCSAPTFYQAFRFFREKYFIVGYIVPKNGKYIYNIISNSINLELMGFKTYKEAELACLNKLIEIVETKLE
jgi:hypothetical protein